MTPIQHKQCNDVLRGGGEVEDLPIYRTEGYIWSFWQPTSEELAAIVMGGPIAIAIMGDSHPPLSLHATVPSGGTRKLNEVEVRAIDKAVHERYQVMLKITKRIVASWVKETKETPNRRKLVDEFMDLVILNRSEGEVVRGLPEGGGHV